MDFQSYYVFHPSKMEDLRMGAAILREVLDLQSEKEERGHWTTEQQKAAAAAAAQNVRSSRHPTRIACVDPIDRSSWRF